MHVVCQYWHVQVSFHFMESRWPNIFIQEGVWSNSVIHRDSVSTPEYCWCIASHCYACCLPIQACTSEPSFHGAKMAEYLHPGRGVVKPSDPQRQRALQSTAGVWPHIAMHVVCQYRHVQVSLHFMESRWLNIFIQEGVWSNPVIH